MLIPTKEFRMPRIPPVTRMVCPKQAAAPRRHWRCREHVFGPFPVLLDSPEVDSRIATLGHYPRV